MHLNDLPKPVAELQTTNITKKVLVVHSLQSPADTPPIKVFHGKDLSARATQSVQCLNVDWMAKVQSPAEATNFSSSLCTQTTSVAHPAS
jgi:hypothetical protein